MGECLSQNERQSLSLQMEVLNFLCFTHSQKLNASKATRVKNQGQISHF